MVDPRARRLRLTAFVAGLALLLAQALGLSHAIAHGPGPHEVHDRVAHEHDHEHEHSAFDAQHDAGSPECQLFDQLLQAQGGAAASSVWTHAAPGGPIIAASPTPALDAAVRAAQARGPPRFLA